MSPDGQGTGRDVVVVGAGLAGLCAALAAAEAGASVVVLEKTGTPGGSTVLSGGFLALADTDLQRTHGITDSPELLERDILAVGEGHCDGRLVHAYAAGQAELTRWLVGHGLVLYDVEHSSGQSVARSHRCDPSELVDALAARARAAGVEVRTDTPVRDLSFDDDDDGADHAAGAAGVETDGGPVPARAVVLTSGGFSRSPDLLSRFAPGQERALRIGGAGNTGDGLVLAMRAGAAVRDLEFVKGTFGAHPDSANDNRGLALFFYLGAIVVNSSGRRYVDESISYKLLGDACLAQPDPVSFQVFDEAVHRSAPVGVPLFDPRAFASDGRLLRADSVPELAHAMGVPADELVRTVQDYNAGVRAGADAFGRTGLVHGSGDLVPLETPPYYALASTSAVVATYCGLRIDPSARVLDEGGRPLRGLWAAGELTGGFHGAAYMTGTSLGKAAFFGRVAGDRAAAHSIHSIRSTG